MLHFRLILIQNFKFYLKLESFYFIIFILLIKNKDYNQVERKEILLLLVLHLLNMDNQKKEN